VELHSLGWIGGIERKEQAVTHAKIGVGIASHIPKTDRIDPAGKTSGFP
jgi:hypothetical protein